jgi:uncharacterized membrane protein YjjB (DUF3815 family)
MHNVIEARVVVPTGNMSLFVTIINLFDIFTANRAEALLIGAICSGIVAHQYERAYKRE